MVRPALLLCAALGVLGSMSAAMFAVQQGQPADVDLPPISWTCPMNGVALPDGTMHADVYEAERGNCPICKMALVAVRLDTIWTCPVHPIIAERRAGTCPIDRRSLVPMTVAVSWTCAGRPEIEGIAPGLCPDGSATVVKYTPRPHGNHNPQHGGQFFMAPDNWHHLEGALPQQRLVRIYVYDNYTKPLTRDRMQPIEGRIIMSSEAAARDASVPLTLSNDGRYLQAQVDALRLPASLVAKLKLRADGPEYHFDFLFTELSAEPPPPETSPAPVQTAVAPAAAPTVMPARIDVAIPDTVEGIVAQIVERNRQIGELIDRGRLTDVWLPAFEAKELALAMGARAAELPTYKRTSLEPAVQRLLRAAWLLDGFGDLGNLAQVIAAYGEFRAAVSGIESFVQARQ